MSAALPASLGESALATFVQQQAVRAESIYRRIETLRTYVPGAVQNVDEWRTRLHDISDQERELCSRAPISAPASRELRRVQYEYDERQPECLYRRTHEHLKSDILELATLILRFLGRCRACEETEYASGRHVDTDFHRHVLVRTIHEMRAAFRRHEEGGVRPLRGTGRFGGISMRELLLILDVIDLPVQGFRYLYNHLFASIRELYKRSTDFDELDSFMDQWRYMDSEIYSESQPEWFDGIYHRLRRT